MRKKDNIANSNEIIHQNGIKCDCTEWLEAGSWPNKLKTAIQSSEWQVNVEQSTTAYGEESVGSQGKTSTSSV